MFHLHERLAADTVPVRRLSLCQVLLMKNRLWPWLILVPERPQISEIHHLSEPDRRQLMDEVVVVSQAMERLFAPDKLNVGALGNIVRQLHVHIVARRRDDPAWPGPVWGAGQAADYEREALEALKVRLFDALF